jgi:4-amino-4-deoxy-L-arabinose transferase-like glycosyltransferase
MQKAKDSSVRVYNLHFAFFALGLALRLLVWRWREFQPLGGDEQEYLNAAVTLLRDRQYVELLFMRPPLYPVFLAASIYVVDSLVQNLRLVQALLSAATIPLVALLTREVALASWRSPEVARRGALAAALLCALSYTLAANAAELLTETLFLFGLAAALWALVRAGRKGSWRLAALAGLGLGALCLVRSVALPLLPLGGLWLLINATRNMQGAKGWLGQAVGQFCMFAFAFCIVVLPWTARNYATYGGVILIDTTGAENLWLDNDPAGREAVKAQLYALGEDRLLRQQLGARNGIAAIVADPGRFVDKAGGELLKFFALEFSDDMRARPAIWVRRADLWLRLALGDALWLVLLLAGGFGLTRGALGDDERRTTNDERRTTADDRRPTNDERRTTGDRGVLHSAFRMLHSPAWLLAPWALYVLLTTLIFHVELRYRLPLFAALLPYAGLTLVEGFSRPLAGGYRLRLLAAALVPLACLALTLGHANYPAQAWQLGWKHLRLGQAEQALARQDPMAARRAASAALALDERSALARVALARASLLQSDQPEALAQLDAALGAIADHPLAHVARGDLLRAGGDAEAARDDLAYETATRQDLQLWSWEHAATPSPARLEVGDGLDLGFVRGMHATAAGEQGFRWTKEAAWLRLAAPPGAASLRLRLASGRPDGAPVAVEVLVEGGPATTLVVGPEWQELSVPLTAAGPQAVVELRSATFAPRSFDRASPDGRALGVKLDYAEVVAGD